MSTARLAARPRTDPLDTLRSSLRRLFDRVEAAGNTSLGESSRAIEEGAPGSARSNTAAECSADFKARFRATYEAHSAFVWKVARARGVREADIADLSQEVWVVVSQRLHDFDPTRAKVTTWLFEIVRIKSLEYHRKTARRREDALESDEALGAAPGGSPEQSRCVVEQIQQLLTGLPEEQMVSFWLFHVEEMSSREIAELCGCSENTVSSRVRLAQIHLAQRVGRIAQGDRHVR